MCGLSVNFSVRPIRRENPSMGGIVENWSLAERIVLACEEPKSVKELLALAGRTNRTKFKQRFLGNLRIDGVLEWTIPDKPNSRLQKYRLTAKGRKLVASFKKKGGRK